MKIKIIKCDNKAAWYNKHTGEEFEVDDHNEFFYVITDDRYCDVRRLIKKENAELLNSDQNVQDKQ